MTRSSTWMPSTITTGRSNSSRRRDSHSCICSVLKVMKRRDTALFEVDDDCSSAGNSSTVV
jgi:hypothetical protein